MPYTIRTRLTVWYATTIGIITICFSLALYTGFQSRLFRELDVFLEEEAELVASHVALEVEARKVPYFNVLLAEKASFAISDKL